MVLHRIIRSVCVLGAGIALIVSALGSRSISRLAVKQIIPHSGSEHLPMLTQIWVVDVANGRFPLIPIALIISALVVASGLYFVFSKRPSPQTAASVLVVVCCVCYSFAVILMSSTMLALVMPFMKIASE